jgi:hypothetical protein
MRSEILSKLEKYSSEVPEEESDVVYLIIQMGKFIESAGTQSHFPVLWFYRNWVVHYQLDKKANDGRQEMLDKLNEAILTIDKDVEQFPELLREAVSLKRLHKEIADFFKVNDLEKEGVNYLDWLEAFDTLLLKVLTDLPLLPPPDANYAFTEFRFNKPELGHEFEFRIKFAEKRILGGALEITVPGELKEFRGRTNL